MDNIIIKQVMDKSGDFSHIELYQNGNVIELSLASTEMDVERPLYKWDNLTNAIARIKGTIAPYPSTQERKES